MQALVHMVRISSLLLPTGTFEHPKNWCEQQQMVFDVNIMHLTNGLWRITLPAYRFIAGFNHDISEI